MSAEPDDEALSWGGEKDPTHVDSPQPAEPEPSDGAEEVQPALSSVALVTFGVFGGIFLLYVVGWIIAVQRMAGSLGNPFFDFMNRLGEVLAIASPAAWFVGVLFLTRECRTFVRVLWLLLGIVILVPLPFILGTK
ncbi:hypothetical protein [Glaciihabitans sp. UYNi722]|uniref:hypothetical protein n=1 Tax=Glaciihabitans sp. UYNi722 TaxID=3156344 RepID=UPI003396D9B9